ncbi:hypothetical protein SH580_20200 [Coraliomargarita algicola]|uniref:Carbohydrate-binding domain-containing protein n=1 Tax=Coraliomargarita algicola TaxID=3092156 RepID=A0ABZ0RHR9_9BACT|nr:hypothetical protein [Coraliomargarita sp. J2-16]WPJ95745.1 hypothetical protein SH580_20200 [Coraliomargarita sp. J2-16]
MNNTPTTNTFLLPANEVETFKLSQPWFDSLQDDFREGAIELHWTPQALIINAMLNDDDIYTTSAADNQHMWELGDVFEVFLQIEGHEDYFELHITPANTRFHAHKPNVPGNDPITGEWKSIDHWLVTPVGFDAQANSSEDGWQAALQIPPSVLGLTSFQPGTSLRIAFARYDGAPGREATLSASSPHVQSEIITFHIPADWHRIVLTQ